MAHKAVPELVLPQWPACAPGGIHSQGHDLFRVVEYLPNQQRVRGPNQSMPMVRHENVSAQKKTQPLTRFLQHVNQQEILPFIEPSALGAKIHAHKENAVGEAQPMNVRHVGRLAPRPRTFKEEPTVRKALTVATHLRTSPRRTHGQKGADRGYALRTAMRSRQRAF